jgi:hypothetical protein
MLEVIIIQEVELGKSFVSLDLYPNTKIDIVWENPFFLFDEISAMFSLTFNIPPTPKNMLIYNYPDRIAIKNTSFRYEAFIKHSGLQIAKGDIMLFKFDNDIQTQFAGSVEISKRPLSEIDLGTKEFNVDAYSISSFGTSENELNYSDAKWNEYKTDALEKSDYVADFPYCIAPVKKADTKWDGSESIYGLKNSLLQYINFFNARDKNFHIGNADHSHTPVIPFPAVHKVIDQIFGDDLANNLFNEGDLERLVFVSAGHPNYTEELYQTSSVLFDRPNFMQWYEDLQIKEFLIPVNEFTTYMSLGVSGVNLKWVLNRFMTNYRCNEAIKDLLKTFSITMFRVNRKWVMEFNNDIFDRGVVQTWNDKLDGKPVVIREKPKNYIFSFEGESSKIEENVIELETWADVFNDAIQAQPDNTFFYKISGSPQILSIEKITQGQNEQPVLIVKIERTALDTTSIKEHEEVFSISSKTKPLNMSIEKYWWKNHKWDPASLNPLGIEYGDLGDVLQKGHWHVPVIDKTDKDAPPNIMLFAGRKPVFVPGETLTPLSSPGYLSATLNGMMIDISFTDTNDFTDHNDYTQGYILEHRSGTDLSWYFSRNIYPVVHWDPLIPGVSVSIPSSSFKGVINELRIWGFSGSNSSQMVRIEINGMPVVDESGNMLSDEYPYLTNHHTDHKGNRMFDFSLIPNAQDSFIEIYHNKMKQWCEEEKLRIHANLKLSAADLMLLDMRDKILLHGRKFFIEKLQFSLYTDRISKTDASLISCETIVIEETPS